MSTTTEALELAPQENLDPITGEPGSHPVGTGLGAAGAGLTGAALGTVVAGPVGGAIGGLVGSILGALGGRALAENIDPTAEDAYWHKEHANQDFAKDDYEAFAPAYRVGYLGYSVYGEEHDTFEDAEAALRTSYEAQRADLPWEIARPAAYLAWMRVFDRSAVDPALDEARNSPMVDDQGQPIDRPLGQKGEALNNPTVTDEGKPAKTVEEDIPPAVDPVYRVLGPKA
jgi:hypothetical protein